MVPDGEAEGDVAAVAGRRPPRPGAPGQATATSETMLAVLDIVLGARASHLWGLLGWQDIRQRYRRSRIGPFWLTISMGMLVGALGVLYAGLFRVDVAELLPFLALGFVIWGLVGGLVTEGCMAFIAAGGMIKQVAVPLSVHVYRVVWRNLIIFGHNFVIYVIVAGVFSIWPGWVGLLALPGLALLCVNGVWMGLLLGLVSARFRDVPQIASSVLQVAFFLTPIIWKPELLPGRPLLVDLNPFFHFLDLIRAPLLGQAPGVNSWLTVLAVTVAGWLFTLLVYRHYRWRIAYWV